MGRCMRISALMFLGSLLPMAGGCDDGGSDGGGAEVGSACVAPADCASQRCGASGPQCEVPGVGSGPCCDVQGLPGACIAGDCTNGLASVEGCPGAELTCQPAALETGANCQANADCASSLCIQTGGERYCSESCTASCPTGLVCVAGGDGSRCERD